MPPDLTPTRWQAFLDDYFRVVTFADQDIRSEAEKERRRRNVMRQHGIVLPDHIEEDEHCRCCELCIGGLARFVHRFDGFSDYQPLQVFQRTLRAKSGYQRVPDEARLGPYVMAAPRKSGLGSVYSLAPRLRAVVAHTAPFAEEEIAAFFRTYETPRASPREAPWTWDEWYARFPVDRRALAHVWHPGYCRRFSAADLKRPDCQVIASAIPLAYIVGAVKISDGNRLVSSLRPNRRKGETLAAKLWTLAHAMRAQYAGTPVVLD